jgi:hypothetical protein
MVKLLRDGHLETLGRLTEDRAKCVAIAMVADAIDNLANVIAKSEGSMDKEIRSAGENVSTAIRQSM